MSIAQSTRLLRGGMRNRPSRLYVVECSIDPLYRGRSRDRPLHPGKARNMDLGIAGKVVFFTGGSKGMGRIAARMLADEGCQVAVGARSKGPVDDAVSEIAAGGGARTRGTAPRTTGGGG